ncbi:hypothetical protein F5B20DRAFT_575981 [Whalleya microplaca]|nr:hypothetical protein F5B20DRAFT_575981 [Whalleya microplaca]
MSPQRSSGSNENDVADTRYRRHSFEDDTTPTPADFGINNPPACINACYDSFVNHWSVNRELGDVCEELSHVGSEEKLWSLYCCDSTYCGVRMLAEGNSPNVDLIINKCKEINYSLFDPGLPPKDFVCASALVDLLDPGMAGPQIMSFTSSSPSATATVTTASSPSADPSQGFKGNATTSSAVMLPSASGGLSEGSKAAIGICSSLALMAIIFLLVFLLTRRRRNNPKEFFAGNASATRHHGRSYSEPPSTPLITPPHSVSSKGPPLTPPARLSDRRFLPPSMLKKDATQTPPHSPSASALDNPATQPPTTTADPEPRATNTSTNSISKSPTAVSPPPPVRFASHYLRDSASSYSSGGRGDTTPTKAIVTGPVSPSRPPRPHDGPLEIPDLITPAGPPPTRALPAPPPYAVSPSPTFTISPVSPVSPVSPGFPTHQLVFGGALEREGVGQSQGQQGKGLGDGMHDEGAIGVALPEATRELAGLTRDYARESQNRELDQNRNRDQESWGSWSGTGGGGPGVSFGGGSGGRKRGHERGKADARDEKKGGSGSGSGSGSGGSRVSLQELDLEKLGGKY